MLQQRARNSLAPVARMYRDIRNIPFAAYRVQAYVTNSGPMECAVSFLSSAPSDSKLHGFEKERRSISASAPRCSWRMGTTRRPSKLFTLFLPFDKLQQDNQPVPDFVTAIPVYL